MQIKENIQSPNYSRDPDGTPKMTVKTGVMMHSTVGSFVGAASWLSTTPEERLRRFGKKSWSSAHFLDDRDDPGVVHQLIDYAYRAWHAGGVNRRTDRALALIGDKDPNNELLGYEMTNFYDINRDGKVSSDEKTPTRSQMADFVDRMFELEEESKTDEWIDIKAEDFITHFDTNHHKPNMEKAYALAQKMVKERRAISSDELSEELHTDCVPNEIKALVGALVAKLNGK